MNGRKRGVVLQGRAREIVYKVNKVFESDKLQANELLRNLNLARIHETPDGIPISRELFDGITEFLKASTRVIERVSSATGVNKNTVVRIKYEGIEAEASGTNTIITPVKKPRGKTVVLDDNELYALSKLITRLYITENDMPTLTRILEKAKSDLNFPGSMSTLRRILVAQLGYKFTRGPDHSKQITIIRPDIAGGSDEDIENEFLNPDIVETEPQACSDEDIEIEYLKTEIEIEPEPDGDTTKLSMGLRK